MVEIKKNVQKNQIITSELSEQSTDKNISRVLIQIREREDGEMKQIISNAFPSVWTDFLSVGFIFCPARDVKVPNVSSPL